ncbi:MAG: hypothetical protein ACKVH8_18220 [Pirellulales bacterium]|jgi:hypothetical protein
MSDDPEVNPFVSPTIGYVEPLETEPPKKTGLDSFATANLVLGGLCLLCVGMTIVSHTLMHFQGNDSLIESNPAILLGFNSPLGFMVVNFLIYILPTSLFLLAGVGLKKRRPWGRILTLLIAAFLAITGAWCLVSVLSEAFSSDSTDMIANLIFGCIISALYLIYPMIALNILLQKKYAAEFIAQPQSSKG